MKTVLVIDDSKTILRTVEKYLSGLDIKVVAAENGMLALREIVEEVPSLILVDVQMDRLNGYEVAQLIRARLGNHVPLVFLTGQEGLIDQVRAEKSGATHFMKKPFTKQQIVDIVNRFVG